MQVRAEMTRGRVLRAAAHIFSEVGYPSASMKDIVTAAGVTKGAAYFHFASKEAIAVALVEDQFAQWPPLVVAITQRAGDPLISVVALTFEVAARFRDDVLVRAGVALSTDRHLVRATLPTPFVGWMRVLTELLGQACDEGLLRAGVDPQAAARALVGGFFGVQHISEALHGRADVQDRLVELWQIFLPGLAEHGDWNLLSAAAWRVLDEVHDGR
jgi:AcrR family transcriptional regulator